MPASTYESQFQKPSTSSQSCFETHNLENNTYFRNDNHDDRLNSLGDFIASSAQEFDIYEDPRAYSHKKPHFDLVGALYK